MSSKSKADLEWERRVLCSDEACIGTIGPDGTCRKCRKPYEGQLPEGFDRATEDTGSVAPDIDPEGQMDEAAIATDDTEIEAQADSSDGDDGWENRTLCSDGDCIGVIGPDGKCKECGRPDEG